MRRSVLVLGTVVTSVGVVEVLAIVLLSVWMGPCAWRVAVRGQQQAAIAGVRVSERTLADLSQFTVVHPYQGYVFNNERDSPAVRGQFDGFPISAFGFVDDAPPLRAASPDEFVIAVFGGSLAQTLTTRAGDALAESLRAALGGRRVSLVRVALFGYKQPQQLLTLAYLLAQGAHFDAVVNLDGFNEVTLPAVENVPAGIYPFFPRRWNGVIGGVADHETLAAIGRVALWRDWRRGWAERIPGGRSAALSVLWIAGDRLLTSGVAGAETDLARIRAHSSRYVVSGPGGDFEDHDSLDRALVAVWRDSSLAMHRLCTGSGIAYYHFLQPNQYVPGSKPLGTAEREIAWEENHRFREPVERGYPLLRQAGRFLHDHGVRFHDLTMVFAEHEDPVYSDSCCHMNGEGLRALARVIGSTIAQDLSASTHTNGRNSP